MDSGTTSLRFPLTPPPTGSPTPVLDILVEGGVRPQNMPPPDEGSGAGKAFLDYLFAIRKGIQQELLRRAG